MTITQALVFLLQFALVVILGTIVAIKWTIILTRLIWQLWAKRKAQP